MVPLKSWQLRLALAALSLLVVLMAGACRPDPSRTGGEKGPPSNRSVFAKPVQDVILITVDTLRADVLGFMGESRVETPVLDRLAATGRVFTRAHAHNVVTLPSHANILTGLLPFQHGIRDNTGFTLPEEIPTLATSFQAAGFATGAFVGAFPLDRRFGLARGFDVYDDRYPLGSSRAQFEFAERRGDEVVAAALRWWKEVAGKRRFLWVHLFDPHARYEPPEPFRSRYAGHPYLGEVAAVDSFLRPLLEPHLEGREPAALLVFTSDHGESLGEHGELTHGLFCYEATLHVPLVLWGPPVVPGRDERPARHIDIAPTILEAAAVSHPQRLPGTSLFGPPEEVATYFEAFSAALNRGWAPLRGILQENRKAIDLPIPELYELERDPRELDNRWPSEVGPGLLRQLPPASAWPPRNRRVPAPEELARLRALGYIGGLATPVARNFGPADDPKRLIEVDRKLHELVDRYSRGDLEGAVALGRSLLAKHPDTSEAYDHTSLALRALGRNEEARSLLETGLKRARVTTSIARQLGMLLAEMGRPKEALAHLEPLAAFGDPDMMRVVGMSYSELGDQERAVSILTQALAHAPQDPRILEALAVAQLRAGRVSQAERHLEEALNRNMQLPTAWNTLGVVRFQQGNAPKALEAWQHAVALDPQLADAHFNLGLVAASLGRVELARHHLRAFLTSPAARGPEGRRAQQVLAALDRAAQGRP